MKNTLILAALLLASLVPSAHADAPVRGKSYRFGIPLGLEGSGADVDAKWSLASTARQEFSTTALNPVDGSVLIRAVCATTTSTAGGYVSIYDTDNLAGVLLGSSSIGSFLAAVGAKILTVGYDTQKDSCQWFPRGLPTQYGVVFLNSDNNMRTSIIYDVMRQ